MLQTEFIPGQTTLAPLADKGEHLVSTLFHNQYYFGRKATGTQLIRKYVLGRVDTDIEHIDQQTELGYQTWRKPLKTQLLANLERRKELLTDKKLLQEAQEACTLIVNLPVDEHNVHFNRDFEAGMYAAYPSKKEASEVYASVIRGPDGVRLSAHSLRKSDKIKLYSAADRVEEWLSEKREAIAKQFGLLLSIRRGK